MILVLGLGTNLGDCKNNLDLAINLLNEESIFTKDTMLDKSKIYRTKALLKPSSPKEWDLDYYNMNIIGDSILKPLEILSKLKFIEQIMGRKQSSLWAPRIIDIDILLYGNLVMNDDNLTIPHKELCNRPWCLKPIIDYDEFLIDPVSNASFKKIYNNKFKDLILNEI